MQKSSTPPTAVCEQDEQRFGEITERLYGEGWSETQHTYSLKPRKNESNEAFKIRVRRWARNIASEIHASEAETRYQLQADKIVRGEIILKLPQPTILTLTLPVGAEATA